MDAGAIRERAGELPDDPGVYSFLDADERVLYVGKAVDLRARVRSYADPRSARIRRMLGEAATIDYAVTDTETQALLLEANRIKRHQPPYNVRLKDDKSYPLVQLTDHPVPRIEVTRDPAEGATVYGPFTNKGRVDDVLKAIRETYGLRDCSDHTYEGRDRPCLDYEMGLCEAPCTGQVGPEAYGAAVDSVERFFEGEPGVLLTPLREEMDAAADRAAFERAASLRDRLEAVERFLGDADDTVSDEADERTVDVLGAVRRGERATVTRLHATDGQLVERDRHHLEAPDCDGVGEVFAAFLPQFYADRDLPDVILCSEHPRDAELDAWLAAEGVALRVPGAGREARLVDLALKNARRSAPDADGTAALADALALETATRVEGFDVSHAGGSDAVGSNVVFVDGRPEKAGYRRKKLADANDDYANMAALVHWRATRAVEGRDDRPDPDLLVVDGGEGQLQVARGALERADWDVPLVALAKADERVVTGEGSLEWPDDAPELHLLQRVRDEAHRFAVQYHQTVRDTIDTVLDDVPGVGPVTRTRLLRRFGSVAGIRAASTAELRGVDGVGEATAAALQDHLAETATGD